VYGCQNRLQHPLRIAQNLVVPEPQDPKPLSFQEGGSPLVMGRLLRLGMLPPIELDHEAMIEGNEVDDVRSDRGLAAKTGTGLTSAQPLPQSALRVGHFLAQPPRPCDLKLAHQLWSSGRSSN
jgi:hypothetical protein